MGALALPMVMAEWTVGAQTSPCAPGLLGRLNPLHCLTGGDRDLLDEVPLQRTTVHPWGHVCFPAPHARSWEEWKYCWPDSHHSSTGFLYPPGHVAFLPPGRAK